MIQLISFGGWLSLARPLAHGGGRPKDTYCTATALHYTGVAAELAAKKGGAKTLDVLITRPEEDLFVGKTGRRDEAFNE